MKLPLLLVAMIGATALSCSCTHTATQAEFEWLYLGIPVDEAYPGSKFRLDGKVPQHKYWRVSRVRHVTKDEYERDIASGRMLFQDQHSGIQFYATELVGDFSRPSNGIREWVTILERKAFR